MQSISFYLKHPQILGNIVLYYLCRWMPDEMYLKFKYRLWMGERLNLKNPQSFCEKLQWLKLYNRKPEYTMMVDKVRVKDFVASRVGQEFLIPTLGVWDDPEKIDFDSLPNRFVLKCNHNSGLGMYICKDKSKMNIERVKRGLSRGLKQDYYIGNREWPYKNVPRRILAEEYIEPNLDREDLSDYKWYCFDGKPMYCQVIQNRSSHETIDFFDTNWTHLDFVGLSRKAHNARVLPQRPVNLETHLKIACSLSRQIPFSRIDLYESRGRVYFGEITFFPASGLGCFTPSKYNCILGQLITLPDRN